MSYENKKNQRTAASIKSRLNKFHAQLDVENDDPHFTGEESAKERLSGSVFQKNVPIKDETSWKTALFACGSNAFNQLNFESFDLMSSTLKQVNLKNAAGSTKTRIQDFDCVACGTNISAIAVSTGNKDNDGDANVCYTWGEGYPTGYIRMPTPVSTTNNILQISCGQSHAGFITDQGKVFTWGSGENGMLGHGNKQTSPNPKIVNSLSMLFSFQVSCGAFHTAVIAAHAHEIMHINVSLTSTTTTEEKTKDDYSSLIDRFKEKENSNATLSCGDLFVFGLGKAGQLGLGSKDKSERENSSSYAMVQTPTLNSYFQQDGYKVARVSCGFHHTLVVATSIYGPSTTTIFSFGWGDFGRLGLGDEEQRSYPCLVDFPCAFQPIDVSAGEQHSLAIGRGGCFSWGSNSMGQLGVGNPASLEFAVLPTQIPMPEGMVITSIAAGGRHSAAITKCNKFLVWGWGEEGQLGHGNEKSCYLPRPCRLPKLKGQAVRPIAVSLGMSHTMVIVQNIQYRSPPIAPIKSPAKPIIPPAKEEIKEEPLPPPSPEKDEVFVEMPPFEEENADPPVVEVDDAFVDDVPYESPVVCKPKSPMLFEEKEDVYLEPIRSIKELLHLREERIQQRETESIDPFPLERPRSPIRIPTPPHEPVIETEIIVNETEEIFEQITEKQPKKQEDKYNIYYRDGQTLDNCLVANSAKRAEMRKLKKQGQSK